MIPNSLLIRTAKGGVGKTSTTAAIAGLAANSGWRVLAIDMDPQGNLSREFGYGDRSDKGEALFQSVVAGQPLKVLQDVRPNLDVIPGGSRTRDMGEVLMIQAIRDQGAAYSALDRAVSTVAASYDLVVVDCPPGESAIHQALTLLAHYIVVPTPGDAASRDGIIDVLNQIADAWETESNPDVELLGVVITMMPAGYTAMDRKIREDLAKVLSSDIHLFTPSIRFAKKVAVDQRERGIQSYEYEEEALANADEAKRARFRMLRERKKAASGPVPVPELAEKRGRKGKGAADLATSPDPETYSAAATGLAGDYEALVGQIMDMFTARQRELGY